MILARGFLCRAWEAIAAVVFGAAVAGAQVPAHEAVPPAAKEAAKEKVSPEKLVAEQEAVAKRFDQLEKSLLEMAELSLVVDPERADVLRKAISQSKDRLILARLEETIRLLQKEQLADASDAQASVDRELRALVELLLSSDRAKRLESEKARIREYLKRLGVILNQQKDLQARTPGPGDPKQLAEEQGRLAGKTDDLSQEIKAREEGPDKPPPEPTKKTDAPAKEQPPASKGAEGGSEGQPKAPSQGQGQDEAHGKKPAPDQKPAPGRKPSQNQGHGQGQGEGQGQGQGQDQDQTAPASSQENPARKRLEAARQRMREAEQQLQEAQRKGAAEKQDEAIRELQQAKAALEEILRQLREEEMERVLASLEARFTKMLQMQRAVLEGTIELDKVPRDRWTRVEQNRSGDLSGKESEIDLEAEKALALLREEGSALAFPEAVGLMREDIRQVIECLSQAKVDKLTQDVEQDVVAALEEMLKALKKALKDLEKQRQQPPDSMPGEPQDQPLVDILSELKLIRSLQVWVNNRTGQYTKQIKGEQADSAGLIDAIQRLAERQERIYRITRDLSAGKNR